MRTSPRGIALIVAFEGYSPAPYDDPVGFATVGYGHLLGRRPVEDADRRARWVAGQASAGRLTEPEARRLLAADLAASCEPAVDALGVPLTQPRFDALVSFVYNLGPGAIGPTTGIGRALRAHDWSAAADQLLRWDEAGGAVLPGLARRRAAERALFLESAVALSPLERRLMQRPLTAATRLALKAQARRVQLAARTLPGGWRARDRARRFQALRRRALST